MYVIQLNGEQHYVQATSAVLSSANTPGTTAITLNQADLPANTYIQQQTQLEPQIQTIQPQTTVIQQQPTDTFQEVIDFVHNLYSELAKEKHLTTYFCLFCTQEFVDLRLLLRHIAYSHRTKILEGSMNLDQDFETLVRKKVELKEQQTATANQQLYQCVQCQQMFNSLDVISEHLNHCQVATTATNVVQATQPHVVDNVATVDNVIYQPKVDAAETKQQAINVRDQYIPYGCAQCGRRYYTIRELMDHLPTCTDETFYDSAQYLHQKYWVGAPKDQHIVINEETTNCILKTSGLWLMPEHGDAHTGSLDLNRGFWVMPASTTDFLAEQQQLQQQQREQEEKLRLQQEQQRLLQEQQEKLRIQEEQKQLREEQEKREREREILLRRQLLEQQEKLRIQQQIEQQKQLLLQQQQQQQQQQHQQHQQQQQMQRQNHSVVQTITSAVNTVPLVKSSPTPVISHQSPHLQRAETTANTIIVLNDEYLSPSASEALKCIQASDGSYHVIGNVHELNERHSSNATSVIAHTSPATTITLGTASTPNQPQTRRKRNTGRAAAKPANTTITYTQPAPGSNQHIVTLENVYQPNGATLAAAQSKPSNAKRKRANQTISAMVDSTPIQTIDASELPQQQFYIAYNDNGVLVPIDGPSTSTAVLGEHTTPNTVEVVNLSHDQYIIEDLDASRKAQQRNRKKPTPRNTHTQVVEHVPVASTSSAALTGQIIAGIPEIHTVDSHANIPGYDIDDLSHLDQPIAADNGTKVQPLTAKPQFMDSFFSFLMNRESNKL